MTDYNFLMESRLSPSQFQLVNELSRIAYAEGINLYLVGGAVRDMTFGQAVVRDLDFAAEGDIKKILKHLVTAGAKTKASHRETTPWSTGAVEVVSSRIDKRTGSADLSFSNGLRAEISQCHQEVVSRPGRPPEVVRATIFDDLKSRDFAFNAMAISLHPNSRGLLLDPKNGAGDIERQEVRALHSRSFWDDPIRIYRLFRLALRFGFKPEEKTQRWLELALEEKVWTDLLPDKQAREIEAVLREDNPERALKLYDDRGILVGLDQSLTKIPYDRFRKVSSVGRKFPGEDMFLLNFDCLVSKLNGPQKQRMAKKVLAEAHTVKLALNLERESKKIARLLSTGKCAIPSQAYKLLSPQPKSLLFYLLAYYPQAKIQTRLKNYLTKVPQIRGRLPESELLVLGVKPGPKFDKILQQVFFDQLDGKIKTHQQMVQALRSLAGIKEQPTPPVPPRETAKSATPVKAAKAVKPAKAVEAANAVKPGSVRHAGRPAKIAQAAPGRKKKRGRG